MKWDSQKKDRPLAQLFHVFPDNSREATTILRHPISAELYTTHT
jgi:hypothetical protein